jgi:regulator of replication initiation timing
MNGRIDPPHITGTTTPEQLRQVIRYLWTMNEQLNMELSQIREQLQLQKEK